MPPGSIGRKSPVESGAAALGVVAPLICRRCYLGARGSKNANVATSSASAAMSVDRHVASAANVAALLSNFINAALAKRPQVLR